MNCEICGLVITEGDRFLPVYERQDQPRWATPMVLVGGVHILCPVEEPL